MDSEVWLNKITRKLELRQQNILGGLAIPATAIFQQLATRRSFETFYVTGTTVACVGTRTPKFPAARL
jgi:hypothetical protein